MAVRRKRNPAGNNQKTTPKGVVIWYYLQVTTHGVTSSVALIVPYCAIIELLAVRWKQRG